ncbi:hypothetical protein GGF43_004399 [Coemansia sp. RSA 2618]|nr:hypothetical protein GGF43_004399 [Coemansia sp. RSA 2618]
MGTVQRRHPGLQAKPDFCTAEYLDAFSSIDQNIRSLIDGNTTPKSARKPVTATRAYGLDSPVSATLPRRPYTSDRERFPEKVFSQLPPGLDILERDDGGDDEEATVAFLCSGLPHYEGAAPIHYDDLDMSLHAYAEQRRNDDDDQALDEEEFVPDSAWGAAAHAQLPSPQTLRGSTSDAGVTAYEGWIDFDELLIAAQDAVDHRARLLCRLGARSESDFMLSYAIETEPPSTHAWVVQVPKPSVAPGVFESEVLSLAYINEHSRIPAPGVLAYSFSTTNPVGVPYAVLDKMPGVPLADYWTQLKSRQKRRVLDHIAEVVVQLSKLEFPLIGSLAIGDGELTIGPLLDARQSEPGYAQLDPQHTPLVPAAHAQHRYGPFASTSAYHHAMIQASLDALTVLEQDHSGTNAPPGRASEPSLDRIELETYASLAPHFESDTNSSGPFVLMPESLDLHHFLFDPQTCQLTGVVDWTFCGTRPLATLVQPPAFTFDETPRWEPIRLDARLAHRRNLVRYRQWFKAGLQKKAWAALGKDASDEMAQLVRLGYWRFKFETEICESVQYSNPWSFRAIWEHAHPNDEFAVWFATAQAKSSLL